MTVSTEKTVRLIELYASIQGESTWAGLPCTFIRFARCPLRCTWCDTTYSFTGGEPWAIEAVVAEAERLGHRLVEITGGEPLAQDTCADLCAALLKHGFTVLIETSGALPIDILPAEVVKIMDLKCPDSGECEKNHWPNIDALNAEEDEVKFVIASRRDYEWSREIIGRYTLEARCKTILLSPAFGLIEPREIVAWMLEDRLPARFQLQMHKFIWDPKQKGV